MHFLSLCGLLLPGQERTVRMSDGTEAPALFVAGPGVGCTFAT